MTPMDTKALDPKVEEILDARQKRAETVHERVFEAREKIRKHLHPESPSWQREAFDALHAVHHILGGDPFDMHIRAALAQPAAPSDHAGLVNEERLNAAADVLARDGYNVLAGSIREAIAALSHVGPVAVKPVVDELGGSTTAYTREQLAKLAFAVFYSSVLCAPENIAAVIKEIDCCPGCDHTNGSTCHVSERGGYCPNDLANDLRSISAALYGPRDPDHYVASVFGPDKMSALATPPAQGDAAQPAADGGKDG